MKVLLFIALCVVASGCYRPTRVGYWSDTAYYPSRSHYRIGFDGPPGSREIIAGWTASNFVRRDGRPTTALGHRYVNTRRFEYDADDSGRIRYVIDEARDLSLVHPDRSRIELWTEPVTRTVASYDLGEIVVALATLAVRDRPLDLSIAEHARVSLDGQEAHQAFFEVRDQRPVAPGLVHIPMRSCLVVVRPTRRWVPAGSHEPTEDGMAMLVFFMITADAEHFDARYAEFEAMLRRVDFR
jgi:hypothetical protein